MFRKDVKNCFCSGAFSGVGTPLPEGLSEAHLEAAKLLEEWAASREGPPAGGWNYRQTLCVRYAVGIFEVFYGSFGQRELPRPVEDSPQRAECIEDDDYFLRDREGESRSCNPYDNRTCLLHGDSAILSRNRVSKVAKLGRRGRCSTDLINKLPDELLCEIFRFMPRARDRAACASVCMRWLMLQSHMHREEFRSKQYIETQGSDFFPDEHHEGTEEVSDEAYSQETRTEGILKGADNGGRVERQPQWAIGDLSRCLEGKKATDVRLAAIAVGTGARGGLGKLSIRRGSLVGFENGVTDTGLSAIGFCCSALRNLSLWDCSNIRDEGLCIIGKGCRLLEKVDLIKCPLVGNVGLQSIAANCPLLSSLSLDECVLIGNRALTAVGEGCPDLLSLSIQNCPLIGDDGLVALVCNAKKLRKMKLEGLKISNKTLSFMGIYCKAIICLSLLSLELVTEEGFMMLCEGSGMQTLKRFAVTSCNSFSDVVLALLGNAFSDLKHLSLVKCERVSDQGISLFAQTAASLEILQLERCNMITGKGLTAAFGCRSGKLREVHVKKCDGIHDLGVFSPASLVCDSTIKSICLAHCRGVGDMFLALMGCLCPKVVELDLTGLTGVSDEGLLSFLYSGCRDLVSVNVSGCVQLTDRALCGIAKQCGRSLRNFALDGCKLVTDKGLKAIALHCIVLEDLDVSQCSVSDEGVLALVAETGQTLSSLNLSGCGGITDRILPMIEEKCQGLVGLNLKHCMGLTRRGLDNFVSRLWKCDVFYP